MKLLLILVITCLGGSGIALARTHTLWSTQDLRAPDGYLYLSAVAIDGGSAIVLAERFDQGQDALLYTRRATGQWQLRRVLLGVDAGQSVLPTRVIMKNGIALLRSEDRVRVYEHLNGDWVEGAFAAPQVVPARSDLGISGRRLAIGVDGCTDDTRLFEKSSTTGLWTQTGRVTGPPLACESNRSVTFDLNENTLMVRRNATEVHVYARHLQQFDWPHVEDILLPPDSTRTFGPVRVQKTVAVAPAGFVYRRTGGVWNDAGRFFPIDYAKGTGGTGMPVFRDGVLVANDIEADQFAQAKPYVYVDNGSSFDHAAILETPGSTNDLDVSKGTVAAISVDPAGEYWLSLFELPAPVLPPRAIANDFQARDVSDWQPGANSQFALAQQGSNYFYRQSALTGEAAAVHTGSDWRDFQNIEADIAVLEHGGDEAGVGLALHYVDAANNYHVKLRRDGMVQLRRVLNGEPVTLAELPAPLPPNGRRHVKLAMVQNQLQVYIDGTTILEHIDESIDHGRVALMTFDARADFDNVFAAPTAIRQVAWKDWAGADFNRDPAFTGGTWQRMGEPGAWQGMGQSATTGGAMAITGVPIDDQRVITRARLDEFNPSPQGAWLGLFARYVDARTHYYLTLRSSGVLQIRKQVNGVITVLASTPFAASPGTFYDLRFDVLGNQLHAYVNDVRVAQAIDDDIASGSYGLGTYRTAATFRNLNVLQP